MQLYNALYENDGNVTLRVSGGGGRPVAHRQLLIL